MYSSLPASTSSASSQMGLVSVVLGSLLTATLAYSLINHEWSLPWCFYYATQAVFGVNYGNLPTANPAITVVTSLFLYIFGSAVCASAVGAFVTSAVSDASLLASEERKRRHTLDSEGEDEVDDTIRSLGIFHNKTKAFFSNAIFFWILLGTSTTSLYKHMSLSDALLRVLGAVSAGGIPPPELNSFTDQESVFLALYIIVGVPLFAAALGQLSLAIVEDSVRSQEKEILSRPLTEKEYGLVKALHHHHGPGHNNGAKEEGREDKEPETVDLSDFIVLELLRLQRIDEGELRAITYIFDSLQEQSNDGNGAAVEWSGQLPSSATPKTAVLGRRRLNASHVRQHFYRGNDKM